MIDIRKLICRFSLVVFLICAGILIKLLIIDPYFLNKYNKEVKNVYHDNASSEESKFESLLKINKDIKAWIFLSGTPIDYPVLYSEDGSNFYLNHNYKKEETRYGSIFIDPTCKNTVNAKNIVVHGHHMKDGQMFAALVKFSDVDFYKKNPVIEFDTPSEESVWKIVAVFKTNTLEKHGKLFNYIISEFNTTSDFLDFVKNIKIRSVIDIPVDINKDDRLLTLSTCSYEFEEFRTVVVARKLREGESRVVENIDSAKKASNPLMPDCWYERYGGTPPKLS